jgi:hypothetical protein
MRAGHRDIWQPPWQGSRSARTACRKRSRPSSREGRRAADSIPHHGKNKGTAPGEQRRPVFSTVLSAVAGARSGGTRDTWLHAAAWQVPPSRLARRLKEGRPRASARGSRGERSQRSERSERRRGPGRQLRPRVERSREHGTARLVTCSADGCRRG